MKNKIIFLLIFVSLNILMGCTENAVEVPYKNHLQTVTTRTEWFREVRLGAIIHLSPGVISGSEISWARKGPRRDFKDTSWFGLGTIPVEVYDNYYKQFSAEKFDAKEWIQILKSAGLKYIVFTTKHWDGFCNFDSEYTDYKITNPDCPFGRDMVKEIVDACRELDFKIGLYYARPDWYHPDYYTSNHGNYVNYFENQVRELLTNYGKIDILWFDGGHPPEISASQSVLDMVYSIQPDILVNDRLTVDADFKTTEFYYQDLSNPYPWEGNFTLGIGWSWKPDEFTIPLQEIIGRITNCLGRNGNFSLGIGPKPDGSFTDNDKERLAELGNWLEKTGEAYYGTLGGPFEPMDWGAYVYKDSCMYVHILYYNEDIKINIPVNNEITDVTLLNDGKQISYDNIDNSAISLKLENSRISQLSTIVKITFDKKLHRGVRYE